MIPSGRKLCMFKEGKDKLTINDRKCIGDKCEAWIDELDCCTITLLGRVLVNVINRLGSGDQRTSRAGTLHDM
jgi:hypothetical protein